MFSFKLSLELQWLHGWFHCSDLSTTPFVSSQIPATIRVRHREEWELNQRIIKVLFMLLVFVGDLGAQGESVIPRVTAGLQLLYDFESADGNQVIDRSGIGTPLNLQIQKTSAVRRQSGSLEVRGATLISSSQPATKVTNAVKQSGEITVEVWVRPANTTQEGPARMVTISNNPTNRNFTLGQEKTAIQARFRTSSTSDNGMPALETGTLESLTRTQHIVYVRFKDGTVKLYRDGRVIEEGKIAGAISNWNAQYPIGLANEMSGDRPFLGTYFLVAIYNKALNNDQVLQNFKAGAEAKPDPQAALLSKSKSLFDNQIAAVFAHSCLECHDSLNKAGDLDLSRKGNAFKGGESGVVLVGGELDKSRLWDLIENNEMPKDRSPLRDSEKNAIKAWIESGAEWTTQQIDPALFVHQPYTGASWIRRLTLYEYIETVRSCFGIDIAKEAAEILPSDLRADGFSNTAYNLTVDLKHVESYANLASAAAEKIDVRAFLKKYTNSTSLREKQKREVMGRILKDLLRGPVTDREVDSFMGIVTSVSADNGDFVEGMGFVLQAVMQSPRFLYRMESQRGDGSAWPASPHELAVRMSYIIWGAPPDNELYRSADAGELGDSEGLKKQIARMLDDPRAERRAVQFAYEWLNLSRLYNLNPNKEHFPNWDPKLAEDMKNETLEFFREVVWKQNKPLSALLNSQFTFLTPALANHYGLEPKGESMERYELTRVESRGGLLTHGSLLTVGGDEASMVARGLFVMQDLLRGVVQDPPPCVDTTPMPTKAGLTQRGIADGRLKNNACNGCHAKFEPLAFGLERFDGIGAWNKEDSFGNALREDGNVLIPGEGKSQTYKTSAELMAILAGSERVKQTFAWKLTQYALGRSLSQRDAPTVEAIYNQSMENGGTYRSLITAIVTSDLVQLIRTESEE